MYLQLANKQDNEMLKKISKLCDETRDFLALWKNFNGKLADSSLHPLSLVCLPLKAMYKVVFLITNKKYSYKYSNTFIFPGAES